MGQLAGFCRKPSELTPKGGQRRAEHAAGGPEYVLFTLEMRPAEVQTTSIPLSFPGGSDWQILYQALMQQDGKRWDSCFVAMLISPGPKVAACCFKCPASEVPVASGWTIS